MKTKHLNSRGFTIIELLIATVVFSVVLLVITAAIVQFGKLYYRSTVQTRTQETVRSINEDITQALQFSGNDSGKPETYGLVGALQKSCIGRQRYTYTIGGQSLKRDLLSASEACQTGVGTNSRELLGANMWLSEFSMIGIGNYDAVDTDTDSRIYTVTVRIAYAPTANDLSADKKSCQYGIKLGGQFCGVSDLTTTVTKR